MPRRSNPSHDSLDLLLDTICNTFGGVLFISMLVVVLLSMSGRGASLATPDFDEQDKLLELERRRAQSTAELARLRDAAELQQGIEEQIDSPELREAVARLREAQVRRREQEAEAARLRGQVTAGQIEINRVARLAAQSDAALEQARQSLAQVLERLEREIAARTRTAALPVVRRTEKVEAAFFLKENRLCALAEPDPGGSLTPNDRETQVKTIAAGRQSAEPLAGAGLLVDEAGSSIPALRQKLRRFEKGRHFVTVVVWPDSFAAFQTVRQALVELGFEYRVLPWPEGQPVMFGAATSGGLVQ